MFHSEGMNYLDQDQAIHIPDIDDILTPLLLSPRGNRKWGHRSVG